MLSQSSIAFTSASRQVSSFAIRFRPFHSSFYAAESHRKRAARERRVRNQDLQMQRAQQTLLDASNPVLGHPVGDDSKWQSCKLSRTLLSHQHQSTSSSPPLTDQPIHFDDRVTGLSKSEHELLFEHLPEISSQATFLQQPGNDPLEWTGIASQPPDLLRAEFVERHKASMLARVIDIRNGNADDLAFENRKRVVAAFSTPSQPHDTGRPEVQAALLTMKIRNLWSHLSAAKRDVTNVRHLRRLVHQRAKLLKYLKGLDFQRWETCLEDIGIRPEAIEGELVIKHPNKYI